MGGMMRKDTREQKIEIMTALVAAHVVAVGPEGGGLRSVTSDVIMKAYRDADAFLMALYGPAAFYNQEASYDNDRD